MPPQVIPPGMEFNQNIEPDPGDAVDNDVDAVWDVASPREDPPIWTEVPSLSHYLLYSPSFFKKGRLYEQSL